MDNGQIIKTRSRRKLNVKPEFSLLSKGCRTLSLAACVQQYSRQQNSIPGNPDLKRPLGTITIRYKTGRAREGRDQRNGQQRTYDESNLQV